MNQLDRIGELVTWWFLTITVAALIISAVIIWLEIKR